MKHSWLVFLMYCPRASFLIPEGWQDYSKMQIKDPLNPVGVIVLIKPFE